MREQECVYQPSIKKEKARGKPLVRVGLGVASLAIMGEFTSALDGSSSIPPDDGRTEACVVFRRQSAELTNNIDERGLNKVL